ncbi:Membrane protein involved in the export of O-antigen and teichoic acid [Aliiroseovarius halocynthiae]|uniref:Lipopolysaccharide biosynthesis protein n=1 Tax=Aliiroseovarius halocynthiae TaxID=985055 RepID=A0A545SUL3_9RHOB|nr:lipopolysaccharide biosynthesis protein [Aliiroseovarius halocynthiae]TQV68655.1 lipopolysaccharide biosynthesis protein [Aliiroseovarius halocynthiae]SMR71075.1 Membrane protein involved in the export of O-antigen and teichoic acid [Aliiroseovarius halocynthiae]
MIQRLRQFLPRDQIALRLLRNLKWIFSSQIVIAVLGMVSLAISARALGAAELGALALIEAFARINARLVHIEPWQAMIQYGSSAMEEHDSTRFERLVGLSIVVDVLGGLAAATLILLLAPLISGTIGLEGSAAHLLSLGAIAVVLSLRATGVALLRLYDRFDQLAKIDTATAFMRLGLSAIAWLIGGNLLHFVIIFILFSLAEGVTAFLFGHREMRKREQTPRFGNLHSTLRQNRGFLRFMWNSNLAVILRQTTQRLDVVILGALVAPVFVGHYHIARKCGDAAIRLGRPIKQAIFPELSRLAASGDFARIRKTALWVSIGFCAILLAGVIPTLIYIGPILNAAFGEAFIAAAPVVSIQAVAVALFLAGVILGPVLLSLGRDRELMLIGAATAALFFILIYPFVVTFGVNGAALSHLISNTLWLGASGWLVIRTLDAKTDKPSAIQTQVQS